MRYTLLNGLDSDLRQYGLGHPGFAALLEDAAAEISATAREGANEATISASFDVQLASALSKIGVRYHPSKEEALSLGARRIRGRIDSRVGDVIVEFKRPVALRTVALQEAATRQVIDYAMSLHQAEGRSIIAYVLDGTRAKRIELLNNEVTEGPFRALDGRVLLEYARAVVSTDLVSLSGRNLVDKLTGANAPTKALAAALFHALTAMAPAGRTQMLFQEWQLLFKLAHDDTSQQKAIEERRIALEQSLGVDLSSSDFSDQYRALFALQTAYSVTLKMIGMSVLHGVTDYQPSVPLTALADAERKSVQIFLQSMEDGSEIRHHGVENLLEGDFFSWYAHIDQYNDEIHHAIRELMRSLADFDALPAFQGDRVAAHDLFKDFYMHMIPDKVRHSLGEYYTPSWLADDTIGRALDKLTPQARDGWRFLDPTCGSGTFLTMAMQRVFDETAGKSNAERLDAILSRVVGIDLNPLAVLTARINYFINVSPLLSPGSKFHIPVYLGDASVAPTLVSVEGVECLQHEVATLRTPLRVTMPLSALRDVRRFTVGMARVESLTRARLRPKVYDALMDLVPPAERSPKISVELSKLSDQLIELEENDWNGIWPRIIADFLTTAAIGKFQVIAGNPPWIDWKNLPENYRRSLVSLCVERDIFSGDGITGGINLNVCALIALTVAENWLHESGALSILMPDSLLFQQSYEGFRKFKTGPSGRSIYLTGLTDWKRAGYPFYPVQQKFFTYVFGWEKPHEWPGVPVRDVVKARGQSLPAPVASLRFDELDPQLFHEESSWVEQVHKGKTYYSRGGDAQEARAFASIAGHSPYRGREGIEFYPQELMLFEYVGVGSNRATGLFKNYQNSKSKHRVPPRIRELELSLMRPLVKGPMISKFHVKSPEFYVPFYYDPEFAGGRAPISLSDLIESYPGIAKLLVESRDIFDGQTAYNKRIIGKNHLSEFYAIARVGAYSHAPHYVCFRDNTSWGASVASDMLTPWGDSQRPVFQNHAVSICEREDGSFITLDEAHYICAILNSSSVSRFITSSSEQRSFKIRVPVGIPLFDGSNEQHRELARLSRRAHASDSGSRAELQAAMDARVEVVFRQSTTIIGAGAGTSS